jgi:hypothetical protein
METLQSLVLPNLDVPGDESLYVRVNDRASCELSGPRVRFRPGGELWSDTFYGGLTIATWKQASPIRSLVLELAGEGEFVASLGWYRLGQALVWLDEREIVLARGVPAHFPVQAWERLHDGMLFVRLRARTAGVLASARYRTEDPAPNDVRLGLVVTHFNRQAQVLPAIERLRRHVLQHPEVQGRITLTVVDNSSNLAVESGGGVAHLPNRNLGGSGGFARGLLALEDEGRATHCVFMDDDASCEADGVLRTYALLRYAASPRLAVAGALVNEAEPWQLLEKGALFDGKCRPLHAGLDLRRVPDLLLAERRHHRPDYGGWWFYAFPIREVAQYPFPFFVRGDDVFFSLNNRFDVLTMNGIACLAEEFRVKHGPMTSYLDGRYHLLHVALRGQGRGTMLRRLSNNQFVKPLLAYHYSSARAFTLALRHVAQGPRFFRDNLDMASVRAEIGAWQPAEKLQPIDRTGLKLKPVRHRKESGLRRAWRAATLQGFLLPRAFLRKRVLVQEKSFYGRASDSFRFQRVLYEHVSSDTGYLAEYDRARFFRELRDFAVAMREFVRRLPQLEREYADEFPRLASKQFWREVYGLTAAPEAAARGATLEATPVDATPVNGHGGSAAPVKAAPTSAAPASPLRAGAVG